MKFKKALWTILAAVVLVCALALAACQKPDDNNQGDHSHNYGEWQTNDSHHWHQCVDDVCPDRQGSVKDYAQHVWANDASGQTKSCTVCGAEVQVGAQQHNFSSDWSANDTHHWHACTDADCLEISENGAHNWQSEVANGVKTTTCSVCGKVVTENLFAVTFVANSNVGVTVYPTQDTSEGGQNVQVAYAKDKDGEYCTDGNGQVVFRLDVASGYVLDSIVISNTDQSDNVYYKNLKSANETGAEHVYRITKISGDITVNVATTSESNVQAHSVQIVGDAHSSVVVSYEKSGVAYSRDGDTGALTNDGSGQVNFLVLVETGYVIDSVTIENADGTSKAYYKNLKSCQTDADFAPNQYRITKITGDLNVTITTVQKPYEITFEIVDGQGNVVAENVVVTVYGKADYETDAVVVASGDVVNAKDGTTGVVDNSGDGQVNFTVAVADGYTATISAKGAFKNQKDLGDGQYRVTKVAGDVTITIIVTQQSSEE